MQAAATVPIKAICDFEASVIPALGMRYDAAKFREARLQIQLFVDP